MILNTITYIVGLGLVVAAGAIVVFIRILAETDITSMLTEGSLAFLFVTSLITGISILWRQNMLERREHVEEIKSLVTSHKIELENLNKAVTERYDATITEYKRRLETLEQLKMREN